MRKRHALSGVLLLAALLAATPAWAQVAAPSLLPGTMNLPDPEVFYNMPIVSPDPGPAARTTFVTENPAAQQWGAHSDVGIGLVRSKASYDGAVTDNADYNGRLAGFRYVSHYVSLGVADAKWDGSSNTLNDTKMSLTDAAAAFQLFDVIALGMGQYTQKVHFLLVPTSATIEFDRKLPTAGLSLRLGGLHLGYSKGRESGTFRNVSSSVEATIERDVRSMGIAYLGQGPNPVHVELSRTTRDFVYDAGFGIVFNEEKETTAVLEAQLGGLVVGVTKRRVAYSRDQVAPAEHKQDSLELTAAWVTGGGWTFTAHGEKTDIKDNAGTFTRSTNAQVLSVGYRF